MPRILLISCSHPSSARRGMLHECMDPELKAFIDQAPWCRASVETIAGMLPLDDAELDRLIAETTREYNALGFMFRVYAAFSRNRPVQAHHLIGGARLIIAAGYVPPIAFRVKG